MHFGGVRHQLIEGEQNEIGTVVHEHRAHTMHRGAGADAHHALFRQRRIEYPPGVEFFLQAFGHAEHGGRVVHALTGHEHRRIVIEREG